MTSVRTTKKPLTGWVSPEIYQQVLQLCSGDDSPYKSISEYVTSLVNRDLALRDHKIAYPETPTATLSETSADYTSTQAPDIAAALMAALDDPEFIAKLKTALQTPQP